MTTQNGTSKPWTMVQLPNDVFLDDADRPWVKMGDFDGSYVKVLHADRAKNMVVFLYRLEPHSTFPMHEHTCTAIAYTLDGDWAYGDVALKTGSLAVETQGSRHAPSTAETGFSVLTVLIGEPGQSTLLRSQDPDSLEVSELDIDFFIDLMEAPAAGN